MTGPAEREQLPSREFTDADADASILRSLRIVGVLTVLFAPVAWLRGGWQSTALLLVGAAISASGLWEWRRLMAALTARMEARPERAITAGKAPSIRFALAWFFVRLLLVLAVLYVSLSYLNGSALALAAGLAMGVAALTFEGIRLLKSGTI